MDVGRILGAGFRLVQQHPVAVAIWALINILLAAASQYGLSSMFGSMIGTATNPTPDFGAMMNGMGTLYAVQLLAMVVQLVIWGAVYRAVFRPDDSRFAFLRLSGDEGRLFLIGLIGVVVLIGLGVAGTIVFAVIGVGAGSAGSPGGGVILLIVLTTLALFVGIIFLSIRFALAWPMAVADGRVTLGQAWRLSKGHFWPMFGAALVLIIGLYVASTLVSALQFGGLLTGFTPGGDPQQLQQMIAERFSTISVTSVLGWILGGIVSTGWIVAMGAGIADALIQLRPDDDADALAEIYA